MSDRPAPDPSDPKGLIREAYRIEGITASECRSIFMDWALSLPNEIGSAEALGVLVARYGAASPDHPMTEVLRAALAPPVHPTRRGGWRGRRAPTGDA